MMHFSKDNFSALNKVSHSWGIKGLLLSWLLLSSLVLNACQRQVKNSQRPPEASQAELRLSLSEDLKNSESSQLRFFPFDDFLTPLETAASVVKPALSQLSQEHPEDNLSMLLGDYIVAVFSPPSARFEFLQLRGDGALELHSPQNYYDGFLLKSLNRPSPPISFVLFDDFLYTSSRGFRLANFPQPIGFAPQMEFTRESEGILRQLNARSFLTALSPASSLAIIGSYEQGRFVAQSIMHIDKSPLESSYLLLSIPSDSQDFASLSEQLRISLSTHAQLEPLQSLLGNVSIGLNPVINHYTQTNNMSKQQQGLNEGILDLIPEGGLLYLGGVLEANDLKVSRLETLSPYRERSNTVFLEGQVTRIDKAGGRLSLSNMLIDVNRHGLFRDAATQSLMTAEDFWLELQEGDVLFVEPLKIKSFDQEIYHAQLILKVKAAPPSANSYPQFVEGQVISLKGRNVRLQSHQAVFSVKVSDETRYFLRQKNLSAPEFWQQLSNQDSLLIEGTVQDSLLWARRIYIASDR
ncbi:MAG: hypothetical protein R2880_03045 [Deinococcales bacterium]